MPRLSKWNRDAVAELAARQGGFVLARQLAELNVPRTTVAYRNGELGGMFSWVLPGVHLFGSPADLSITQQEYAALLYAGERSMLTGRSGLRHFAVRAAEQVEMRPVEGVHVLVPHERQRASYGFARVERTRYLPATPRVRDGVPCAPVARCTIDCCRCCSSERAVLAVVTEVVQRRLTTPEQLGRELACCQRRGSRFPRLALKEVQEGVRSVAEADFKGGVDAFPDLPRILYNPKVLTPDGEFIASPDAYEPITGTAAETDSEEFHYLSADWKRTMARHARMTAEGLAVLHFPPSRLRDDCAACVREFAATVRARHGIALPPLTVMCADGTLFN